MYLGGGRYKLVPSAYVEEIPCKNALDASINIVPFVQVQPWRIDEDEFGASALVDEVLHRGRARLKALGCCGLLLPGGSVDKLSGLFS